MHRTLVALSFCLPLAGACGARPAPVQGAALISEEVVYSPAPIDMEEPGLEETVEDAFTFASTTPEVAPLDAPSPLSVDEVDEPSVTYHLRRGETLDHFARWAELPVEVLAAESGVSLLDPLPVGTVIRIPADQDRRSRIEFARDGHHERRTEGYLASRGGAYDTVFHVVRTGETAWSIAKENGRLPVWIVEAFNPSLDLEDLRPGQSVMLPVPADMVEHEDAVSDLAD